MIHDLLQPTKIALRRSSSVAHTHTYASLRAPGSRLKSLGQQSDQDLLPFAWFLLVDFSLVIAIDDATGHARSGAQKYRTRSRRKVSGRQLQNTVGRVSRSRDLFLFGLIKKNVKRAGLPKRIRSPRVLIHTCAGGGWRTQHPHRNCSFFFCSGSFFVHASSSSQGGFSAHFAQCSYAPVRDEFPQSFLVAATIFPHTNWLKKKSLNIMTHLLYLCQPCNWNRMCNEELVFVASGALYLIFQSILVKYEGKHENIWGTTL